MYKEMYLKLFNCVTDALCALEERNYEEAERILKLGQQETEELYLEGEGPLSPGENNH